MIDRAEMTVPPAGGTADARFLRACRLQPTDATPVWFMRQAGRSLPEYRALRERYSLLDIVENSELCTEVTLQPVRRLGVDAAVMFADIMLPTYAMGIQFDLVDNVGPVIANPVRSAEDVAALTALSTQEVLPQLLTAVRQTAAECPVPVICFSGAPFTLASYLVEGKPSRTFTVIKQFMYNEPAAFGALMEKLTSVAIEYVSSQVRVGAHAVQLFDSWIGALGADDFEAFVRPHTIRFFQETASLGVPRVYFGTGNASLLPQIATLGAEIISVDWRMPLGLAWETVGFHHAIQGNLDPAVALGPLPLVEERARSILAQAAGRPGHIFNLGHGVLPATPVETLQSIVETVHTWSERDAG